MKTGRNSRPDPGSFPRDTGFRDVSAAAAGIWLRGLFACGVMALTGCTSIQVALGLKMRLNNVPVSSLTVAQFKGPGLGPGKGSRLVAVATTTDGKQLVTEGAGRGKVLWDSFDFETSVVQLGKKGVVRLSPDPRDSEGQVPHVRITVKGRPDITAEIDIPVRYDVKFKADFSGAAGADGANGSDGSAGDSGASGSTDPKDPRPGGNGWNGGPGGNGGNGQPGEPGQDVSVWVTLKGDNGHPLLQVKVASATAEKLFLIDPRGGSLVVRADGGAGGSGGAGGRGGQGGSGGSGKPNGNDGSNGSDGTSGWPGEGGAAGSFVVMVDPRAKPYMDLLQFSNRSGRGVPGREPEISEKTVPLLW